MPLAIMGGRPAAEMPIAGYVRASTLRCGRPEEILRVGMRIDEGAVL